MPTASDPTPDDPNGSARLSSWEQQALERIEQGLVTTDPGLDRALRRSMPGPARRWWPLSATSTVLLVVAMAVLVIAGTLVPTSWGALAVITTVVVVPCLLFCAIERRTPDR